MRVLLIAAVVLFALAPYDAQLAILAPLRWLWLSDAGRSLIIGGVGALVVSMFVFSFGWNSAVESVYREGITREEDARKRRMR